MTTEEKKNALYRYNFALRQDQMDFLRRKKDLEGFNMSAYVRILLDNAIQMEKRREQEEGK